MLALEHLFNEILQKCFYSLETIFCHNLQGKFFLLKGYTICLGKSSLAFSRVAKVSVANLRTLIWNIIRGKASFATGFYCFNRKWIKRYLPGIKKIFVKNVNDFKTQNHLYCVKVGALVSQSINVGSIFIRSRKQHEMG